MAVDQLHPKRLEILSLLARREGTVGRTPSIREIAEAVGLKSSQTVHHHLNLLEGAGYLERLDDRPRTPKLTEKGWGAVLDGDTPLLGRIAAGRGLEAVVTEEEGYSLAAGLLLPRAGRVRRPCWEGCPPVEVWGRWSRKRRPTPWPPSFFCPARARGVTCCGWWTR